MSQTRSILQLRCLIRNRESLIEHLTEAIREDRHWRPLHQVRDELEDCQLRLIAFRVELDAQRRASPAAQFLADAVRRNGEAQPANLSS